MLTQKCIQPSKQSWTNDTHVWYWKIIPSFLPQEVREQLQEGQMEGFPPLQQGLWLPSTINQGFHRTKLLSPCHKDLDISKDFGATVNLFLWPVTAMACWLLLSLRPKACSRKALGILQPAVWEEWAQHTLQNLLESCSETTWPDNTTLGLKSRWSFPVLPG